MRAVVLSALIAVLCVLNPLASTARADPTTTCGVNLNAPQIESALGSLPALPQG